MNDLIAAWLAARSIARGLAAPVPDRGGYRVDTDTEAEACRWVFPRLVDGLRDVGRTIHAPRHAVKLCGDAEALHAALPDLWIVQPLGFVMTAGSPALRDDKLPEGCRLERHSDGRITYVRVLAADGDIAASGYAAEAGGVFVYDRIVTARAHRRRGLGRAVMAALGEARRSALSLQVLVATVGGHRGGAEPLSQPRPDGSLSFCDGADT